MRQATRRRGAPGEEYPCRGPNKSCTKDTYTHSTLTLLLQNTTQLGWEVRIFTSTAMFLHQYAIMQDTNSRQHARSFTGIRFRRLDRGPLLGRRPGSRLGFWGLAPGLVDSSIPQMTSRTRSCPPPIAQRKQASLVEGLRQCSWTPQFFNSSSTQETSRASATPADPDAYINGALIARTRRNIN